MKKYVGIALVLLLIISYISINNRTDSGLYGLDNFSKEFSFSDEKEFVDLPSFGHDRSFIENGRLICPIKSGEHKGLGKKFWFARQGGEPNEAEIEFTIWLDKNFQKDGAENEVGKFFGFEGIYDNTAGWSGRKVTYQNSWSARIGHAKENSEGKIPIWLYVYHPGMKGKYGTTIDFNYAIEKEKTYKFKYYIKLNDIGKQNGIMAFSVDGKEIYRDENWVLRKSKKVHIKSVWLNAYIGGKTPSKHDTFIIYDDLKINW